MLYSSRALSDEGSYCVIDPNNMKIPYLHNKSRFETDAIKLLRQHPDYIDGNELFNWVYFFGLFVFTVATVVGYSNIY